MDEVKPVELEPQTPVMSEESTLTEEQKEERALQIAVQSFFQADKMLRKTNLSRGAVIRAIRAAVHEDLTVTSQELKLLTNSEKMLAVALYDMLTARTLMQAQLIKNKESKKGENNEQSSESKQTEVG